MQQLFIKEQIPEHILSENPLFFEFLDAYYEWMETTKRPNALLSSAETLINHTTHDSPTNIQNVGEETLDEFIENFLQELSDNFPQNILISKKDLLNRLKDIYVAKGSPLAYKLLFRILFNDEVELSYGFDRVLIASGAKWVEEISFKTVAVNGKPTEIDESTQYQYITLSPDGQSEIISGTFVVERVISYFENGQEIYEIFTNRSSIKGMFPAGGRLRLLGIPESRLLLVPVITTTRADVVSSSNNFVRGEVFEAIQTDGVQIGLGTIARVIAVDEQARARKVNIIQFGSGYFGSQFTQTFESNGKTITIRFTNGTQAIYPGFWEDSSGKVSDFSVLQDNFKFQLFSYIVKTGNSINRWRNAVKNILHPAGLLFSGEIVITQKTEIPFNPEVDSFAASNKYKFFNEKLFANDDREMNYEKFLNDPLPKPDDTLFYTDDINYLGDIGSLDYSFNFAYRYIPEYDGLGANSAIEITRTRDGVTTIEFQSEGIDREEKLLLASSETDVNGEPIYLLINSNDDGSVDRLIARPALII